MPEPIAPTIPATTFAAAPAPAPAPAPKGDASPFSALDTRARTLPPKKEPEVKPAAEDANPEGDDAELKEVFENKEPEGENPPKPEPPKPATKPVVEAPRALREKLDTASKELETSRKELTTLREKLAEYDRKGIDTTALTAKLDAREKEYQEIKAERDAAKYERSDEFKTKFESPFNKAIGRAKEVVANLAVTEMDGDGNPVQRKATWDDFADLYRMSPARSEIEGKKLFGDNYMVVMRHMDKLRELDGDKAAALQEYQANATQRETQQVAERAQQREKVNQAWEMTNKDLIEANPDWYGERKDDEEGNSLWNESLAKVDQAYGSDREKLTLQQRITLDANIRLRAAAFPRMNREIAQLKAQLAEIDEKRQQREDSIPGRVKKPVSGESSTEPLDMMDDLRKSVGNEPG